MHKLASLRAAIVASFPDLATSPDWLDCYAEQGVVAARAAGGVAWEYRYRATLILLAFEGDADLLFATVLAWVQAEQPDLLEGYPANDKAIGFRADILDDRSADLMVTLDLRETVIRDGGAFVRPSEPAIADPPLADATLQQLFAPPADRLIP